MLYEMLTGNPPHTGATAQQIIMKIIAEPVQPVTAYRKSVPANVASALARALEKLPADRFASAAEFAAALADRGFTVATAAVAAAKGPRQRLGLLAPWLVAGLALGVAAWGWFRPAPPLPVTRYSMAFQPGQEMRLGLPGINLAISPDGRWLVYTGPGTTTSQLYLRSRDRLDATPIPGTDGATNPYFSPDGTKIAFHAGANFSLTVVPVAGGPPIQLDPGAPGGGGGGAWGHDGYIYFDTPAGTSRIPADGGASELVIPLDTAKHELGFAWTEALPNGKGLLFRSRRNLNPIDFDIEVYDLQRHVRHVLAKGAVARYVAPGYLVILRGDGALLAAPFDQDRLALTGPMVPILSGVMVKPLGSADLAISRTGTLIYLPGGITNLTGIMELVTTDAAGRVGSFTPAITINPGSNRALSLSPDGRRVAFDILGAASSDIWVKSLPDGALTRLTFDSIGAFRPQWSADGRYVYYISQGNGSGRTELWKIRSDGGSRPERVWGDPRWNTLTYSISPDGEWLAYRVSAIQGGRDLSLAHLGRDSLPTPLLAAGYWEDSPAISPDGHWLAYTSTETSREEVYVRPFPNVNDGRWQVSTEGGVAPRWSRDGKELFFEDGSANRYAVPVRTAPTFVTGTRRKLVDASAGLAASVSTPYYDQMPDGRHFLMARLGPQTGSGGPVSFPVVVDHWTTELLDKMKAH